MINNYPDEIWTYEGIAFSVPQDVECAPGTTVYRFWRNKLQGHFFTANEQEKNYVSANYHQDVWKYEGVAFCSIPNTNLGATPIYRFWSDRLQSHFYTADTAERDYIISHYDTKTWRYEGVAYHAW